MPLEICTGYSRVFMVRFTFSSRTMGRVGTATCAHYEKPNLIRCWSFLWLFHRLWIYPCINTLRLLYDIFSQDAHVVPQVSIDTSPKEMYVLYGANIISENIRELCPPTYNPLKHACLRLNKAREILARGDTYAIDAVPATSTTPQGLLRSYFQPRHPPGNSITCI